MLITDILAAKRDGQEFSPEAIQQFIRGVVAGNVTDYQASAWLMAVRIQGMNRREILDLTLAMRDSGERIDLTDLPEQPTLDKHSTGGVGDKATLIVVPILAAAGIPMLKMSGRGLGFSGGTIDKLEAIPGFRTELTVDEAKEQVQKIGAALIGQSANLAPADKILYALRDVTATIDSLPLIASSIMSKKLAAGAARIVLDVKAGRGAFMKTPEQAQELAALLTWIGKQAGVPTQCMVSSMDEPLGWTVGNALEVEEAVRFLLDSGAAEPRFSALCRELAAHGLIAAERASSEQEAAATVSEILVSGKAAQKFAEIVHAQGGPDGCDAILAGLPRAAQLYKIESPQDGFLTVMDAGAIGRLAMKLGAGREKKTDSIDPAVGIALHAKTGAHVHVGAPLATLHLRASDLTRSPQFTAEFLAACRVETV